jgi:Ni,Fe-hydrogenase III large subunit
MDEEQYEERFKELATTLETEKFLDRLAERAEVVRVIAMHAGAVYKVARQAGLPRRVAAAMARNYFDYETNPPGVYLVSGGEG